MNDQDIIRKAVELADGWEQYGKKFFCPWPLPEWRPDKLTELDNAVFRDALAAQLVRQVKATGYGTWTNAMSPITGNKCVITDWRKPETQTKMDGEDEIMNTIKAIVDSGVLTPND